MDVFERCHARSREALYPQHGIISKGGWSKFEERKIGSTAMAEP